MSYASETALSHSMGQQGFIVLTEGDQYEGETCSMVDIIEDSIVTLIAKYGDSLNFITLLAGTKIVGLFTAVAFITGSGIAYKAKLSDNNDVQTGLNYVLYNGKQVLYNGEIVIYSEA